MILPYWVYILQSQKDGQLYTGMTKDLSGRLEAHNHGRVPSTKHRLPLKLIYSEEVSNSQNARVREKYWKSGAGREKLQTMIDQQAKIGSPAFGGQARRT
ncbi:MAG: GIY-YIG nuclease family protein [Candidatus Omnitrophica bacterium]|nr:GIY-YIG nuclease family protein [Candidatus Omnitrophota bacterium]